MRKFLANTCNNRHGSIAIEACLYINFEKTIFRKQRNCHLEERTGRYGWLLFVIVTSLLPTYCHAIFYNFNFICGGTILCLESQNYTSVPSSRINNQVQVIFLSKNMITKVTNTDFANSSATYFLQMSNNLLTTFPYLPSMNTSLKYLVLENNRISFVDPRNVVILTSLLVIKLDNNLLEFISDFKLPNLQGLFLTYNNFTEIPNLPLLGETLAFIALSNNLISNIDVKALSSYKNVSWGFYVDSNFIVTFPNFFSLPLIPSQPAYILLHNNYLYCDCRLLWLRTFPNFGSLFAFCSGPPHLTGLSVQNIDASQFTCNGKLRFCIKQILIYFI